MEFTIRPDPDDDEREALALALERLLSTGEVPVAYRSRWRAAGIAENLGVDEHVPEARGLDDRTPAE